MGLNLAAEVATFQQLSIGDLRVRYAELFGEPTHAVNRTWLIRRLAWRLQARAEGDLSERARQRAAELADDADMRVTVPRATTQRASARNASETVPQPSSARDARLPCPGTVLTRRYKGKTVQVRVLEDGFDYGGVVYGSLSAAAKAISGSHCNGFRFFFGANPGAA